MIEKYLKQTKFSDFEDYKKNFELVVPEDFNFAYDIVDELARTKPEKRAMLYVDKDKNERSFTFRELKIFSDKTANYFSSLGIKKGDRVMLVLKRHYQFWFAI